MTTPTPGKNPRLRILELPTTVVGEYMATPYALIVDRAGTFDTDHQLFASAAKTIGATGALIFADEIDLE